MNITNHLSMELTKILFAILSLGLGFIYIGIVISAYSKRTDKSLWGGANILNGWWIVFPYGKSGVPRDCKELVIWGRVSIVSCVLAGWLAYEISNSIT